MAKAKSSSGRSAFEAKVAKLRKEREYVARKLRELKETKGPDAAWEWWWNRLKRKLKGGVPFMEAALEALSQYRAKARGWGDEP
jgi:hypothetical protein